MKKVKKLSLNKLIISNLTSEESQKLFGGQVDSAIPYECQSGTHPIPSYGCTGGGSCDASCLPDSDNCY